MATNSNNIQVNTFTKGMNTDAAASSMDSEQYRYLQNGRCTSNTTRHSNSGGIYNPRYKEGCLAPITTLSANDYFGEMWLPENEVYKILTFQDSYDDDYEKAIVLWKKTSDAEYVNVSIWDGQSTTLLFRLKYDKSFVNLSAVLHKEQSDVVNLYIADGIHKMLQINVAEYASSSWYIKKIIGSTYDSQPEDRTIDFQYIESNTYFPARKLTLTNITSGNLTTSQVQYTFRFYRKHGDASKLAPLTHKFQIIDGNRSKETGNAEETSTSVGLQLKLDIDTENKENSRFDHIQVYRLQYIKAKQNAEVHLILDTKISNTQIYVNDTQQDGISDISLEEFSALNGQTVVPSLVEQNQGYLFAGNIKDESSLYVPRSVFDPRTYSFDNTQDHKATYYTDDIDVSPCDYEWKSTATKDDVINSIESDFDVTMNSLAVNPSCDINLNVYRTVGADGTPDYDKLQTYIPEDPSDPQGDWVLGGIGRYVTWTFVYANVPLSDKYSGVPTTTRSVSLQGSQDITTWLKQWGIEYTSVKGGYNNSVVSSMFRTLKRGEVYRYGIVLFSKTGQRSDVLFIADIRIPDISQTGGSLFTAQESNGHVDANAIGVQFNITWPDTDEFKALDIVGYEIVRCQKSQQYSRVLTQCALARPVKQKMYDGTYSPYYPTGFLTSQPCRITYSPWQVNDTPWPQKNDSDKGSQAQSDTDTVDLFQIYNSEIQVQREDLLSSLTVSDISLKVLGVLYGNSIVTDSQIVNYDAEETIVDLETRYLPNPNDDDFTVAIAKKAEIQFNAGINSFSMIQYVGDKASKTTHATTTYSHICIDKNRFALSKEQKSNDSYTFCKWHYSRTMYTGDNHTSGQIYTQTEVPIIKVSDVKNLNWEDGFSNHTKDSSGALTSASKTYKGYSVSIDTDSYVNWVCNNKYNLSPGNSNGEGYTSSDWKDVIEFTSVDGNYKYRSWPSRGAIGPGGACFLAKINRDALNANDKMFDSVLYESAYVDEQDTLDATVSLSTHLCDIIHTAQQFSGQSYEQHKYDTYYGFGNYFTCNGETSSHCRVFDGEWYIQACEFVSQYKAYDFVDDRSSLQAIQVVNYLPMETKINTYFDYGMCYRNTQSANILREAGEITGITTQDRPEHQYNLIYSDNDSSNNLYNSSFEEEPETKFAQRTFYSELKTNGENIDNWTIFKAANFIDVDSQYGSLTDLYTDKDQLYFWQDYAFGKYSVNERSLVTDNNDNTVQLGQGGVLQRRDYLSTKYGMYKNDMCKISAEGGLFWYDRLNDSIAIYSNGQVNDYSEAKNVRNVMYCVVPQSVKLPKFAYDQQHQELLFAPIYKQGAYAVDGDEHTESQLASALVFNMKYAMATSIYDVRHTIHQYGKDVFTSSIWYDEDNVLHTGGISYFNDPVHNKYTTTPVTTEEGIAVTDSDGNSTYKSYVQQIREMYLSFVINKEPTLTKVFDDQQIVFDSAMQSPTFYGDTTNPSDVQLMTDIQSRYACNIQEKCFTNREGNICYPIPRYDSELTFGARLRGKYAMETLRFSNSNMFGISCILTKFRNSYC